MPAELYGRGQENLHLSLPVKDFIKIYKLAGENTVVNVLAGDKKIPALIYEVTKDYLSDEPSHVDLYAVRMDEKLQTKVPLEFAGESAAVKNLGAILVRTLQEVPVEALPDKIPHSLIVDLSRLVEVGNSIHLADLVVPAEVKILIDPHTVVVTVKAKMTEEQEAALVAEGSVEKVVVETEEKKLERAAEKAAAGVGEEKAAEGASATKEAPKPSR